MKKEMTQVITRVISNTEHSTRLWLMLAFISGMVFMAVLAQTVFAVQTAPPGSKYRPAVPASFGDSDTLTPDIIPDGGFLVKNDTHRLVQACPGWQAMIPG
jgi:hypothetical protein